MKHSFMTSAFHSAIRPEGKSEKSLRSSKFNNSTPSLFDTIEEESIIEAVKPTAEAIASVEEAYNAHMAYLESRRPYVAEPSAPIWQAVALDFNGAEYTEEIEAWTEGTANDIAEERFSAQGVSIYQMFLYRF